MKSTTPGTGGAAVRPCRLWQLLVLPLFASAAMAADSPPQVIRGAQATAAVTPSVFTGDLRTLPVAPAWRPGDPIKEIPRRNNRQGKVAPVVAPANPTTWVRDPLLDRQAAYGRGAVRNFSTPDLSFPGQGYTGVNPPDTVGDVGGNYYIQMINASGGARFIIYDKATGSAVAGPITLDSLGSGFCATGAGDPIVLYDQLAERWLLSEFSGSGNRMCIYISQVSGNPVTGGWYNYEVAAPSFPDYPKYGVWPDAYYISSNESSPAAYALDRSQMLIGAAATAQRLNAPSLSGFGFQALQPSDLDGATPPPAGSPNYFLRHRDDERHNAGSNDPFTDFLEIWEYSVDFANPANTTLTGPVNIPITEIDSELCGYTSFNCFPQPNGVQLDPLREVVMWRLQYRNFGSHETLVGNLVTDVDFTDHGGVRWFELRKTAPGGWSVFQEGTYAPDGDSRFMGSIAMDGSGNMALGYTVTSPTQVPDIRYTGREASAPHGVMSEPEVSLRTASGSNSSNRWGDYSSMNLDPVDDCTFWYTHQYALSNGTWATWVGAFSFDSCGVPQTCGNDVIEGTEVCDGSDLGGMTCADFGCTGGGILACSGTCDAFDTTLCSGCPVCNNNGVCELGEDCNGCANDCVSGTTTGAVCGNNLCETADGENHFNCSQDCNGKQNGKPANRFACGDGTGGTVDCSDSRCTSNGFDCTSVPSTPGSFCCGDGACGTGESCGNCGLDCSTGSEVCNDGSDNDCNGLADCADGSCTNDPFCAVGCELGQVGDSCSVAADCCSNKCKGKAGSKTCR